MNAEAFDPFRHRFERDLHAPAFVDGVEHGRWQLRALRWPFATFAVATGDGESFGIRVNFDGYPTAPPAGVPWLLDADRAAALHDLPLGERADRIFRSAWSVQNQLTPYMATERIVLTTGHTDWSTLYPSRAWNPSRSVAFYLNELHRELQSCRLPKAA